MKYFIFPSTLPILLLTFFLLLISCDEETPSYDLPHIDNISSSEIYQNEALTIYGSGFDYLKNKSYLILISERDSTGTKIIELDSNKTDTIPSNFTIYDTLSYSPSKLKYWSKGLIKFSTNTITGNFKLAIKYDNSFSNFINLTILSHKSIETVLIPSGSFLMGNLLGLSDEKQVRKVSISKSFLMSKHEVSQEMYQLVMGENPSEFTGEFYPVSGVSWLDVISFCNTLSELEDLEPAYLIGDTTVSINADANGWKLPTEAQWEYASNANDYQKNELADIAWYNQNSAFKLHPSGKKKANKYGLYDMIGNLWEWTYDFYQVDYYAQGYDSDPLGAETGSSHVFRGGAYNNGNFYSRATFRNSLDKNDINLQVIGFRIVRNAND